MEITSKAFTLLFNINRSDVDGRNMEDYFSWLEQTASTFENLVIYHDGCIPDGQLQDFDIRKVDKSELKVFRKKEKVDFVLAKFKPVAFNDITFKLSNYSLTQYAKFELGQMLIESDNLESALWVDAGISRFIKGKLKVKNLEEQSREMIKSGYDSAFEIDIRNNLRFFPLRILSSQPGTSRRVISGTSFWFTKKFINEINEKIHLQQELWIKILVWDNEQVMLRALLPSVKTKIKYIPQVFSSTGGVSRAFITERTKHHNIFSLFVKKIIKQKDNDESGRPYGA